jgi:hypothetical protein
LLALFCFYLGSNPKAALLNNWERSINSLTWSKDSQSLFFELDEEAQNVLYKLSDSTSSSLRLLTNKTSCDLNIHPINNQIFVFVHETILQPTNIHLYPSSSS